MKFLYVLFLSTISFKLMAQLPLNSENKIEYSDIVKVDSVSDLELFSRLKMYVSKDDIPSIDRTVLNDDNSKTIVIKSIVPINLKAALFTIKGLVRFVETIQCRTGRFKYSFTDFVFEYQPGSLTKIYHDPLEEDNGPGITKKQWIAVKEQTNDAIKAIISKMSRSLIKQDNW